MKMIIEIDPKKDVNGNAAYYFQLSKKYKKKLEGSEKAIKLLEEKLKELEIKLKEKKEKFDIKKEELIEKKERKKKEKWYHKFRWFITTNNFLVVGGKDASTNETLIKRHLNNKDIVLHCELRGSPFVIIINGQDAQEQDLQEAADFAVTFSRAWKEGIYSYDVAIIKPEQLSKTPRSGEYITKGAFIIKGKTEHLKGKLNLAIGLYDSFIMSGPLEAVKKHCKKYIELSPGNVKKTDMAKKLAKIFKVDVEQLLRSLPAGEFRDIKVDNGNIKS